MVRQLEASLGRSVSLGGITGDLVHRVVLRDLRIAERGGFDHGATFSAAEVRLTFNWSRLFSTRLDVVGSIAKAELARPHLVLSRDAAGRWSFGDFSGSRSSTGPGPFRGRVVMEGGSLDFTDAFNLPGPPFAASFTRIAGVADFRAGDAVAVSMSGWSMDGEGATVDGRYRPGSTSGFDLTAINASVSRWGPYLVRLRELGWERGRFGGTVHLSVPTSASGVLLDYKAVLRLHDADVEYLPLRLQLQHVTGPITVDSMHAESPGLALVAEGSPVVLDGSIVFGGGPWLQFGVKSPGLDLATVQALFFPKAAVTIAGEAAGQVQVIGPAGAPGLDGEITGAHGRLNGQGFDGLHARFQYGAGILSLTDLRADAAGGRVGGDLLLNAGNPSPSYLFSGSTTDVDVHAFASAGLPGLTSLTGRVSGSMVGVDSGTGLQIMGDVTMGQGSLQSLPFDGLHAVFWRGAAGSVDLDYLSGQIGGAAIYSAGNVGADGALDLEVLVHDLSLADIRARAVPPDARPALAQAPLDGSADLTGRATGTTDAPVFSGTVTATHGRLGPIAFARAQGDVTVTPGGLSSHNLVLQNGLARYRLSGGLTFDPPSAVDIRLEAEDVDAQWLSAALAAAPEMTGTLSGDLTLNGPLTAATVAGQVALDRGRVSRQRIDHAEAHLTPEAGLIRIADAEARVNGSRLYAAGTVDPGGPLDMRVWAENLRPADITAALGLSFPAEGGLALSGEVGGTLRNPRLAGEVTAHGLVVGGEAFDASGAMEYQGGTLRLRSLQLVQGPSSYRLSGEIRPGPDPTAGLALDIDHGEVATVLAAMGLQMPAPIRGTIDGRVELSGALNDPSARLNLTLHDATFGAYTIGTGAADLTLTHQKIEIDRFEIHPAQGQVAAKGRIDLAGPSAVEVSAQDLNPDFLRPFFKFDRPFEGKMTFTAQFTGTMQDPTAGLSLDATDVGVSDALADRITGLAYYTNGALHIEQAVVAKGPHKVVVAGTLPVDSKTMTLDPGRPLALQLRLQDAGLSSLVFLTPQITDATGTIAGAVDLAGTVAAPQMTGFLRSAEGRLSIRGLRTPLEHLNVDLSFSQDNIQIRDLSATLGHGQMAASGAVEITNFRPGNVQLAFTAAHAAVDVPGLYNGLVDADLQLSGPWAQPTLSGTATLSDGALSPGAGGAAGGVLPKLGLDVTVEAGQNDVFAVGAIRAHVTGSVHAGGTLDRPLLSGRVIAPDGEVDFLGSAFRLTSGEAVFSESLGIEPRVSIRAQQVYGDTLVFLDINGLAYHLTTADLAVTSDPPMTQADLLNMIARNAGYFGDPESILGQGVGRYLLGSIRGALNLSEFAVTYGHESPVTLRIGKFLLQNIYLTVSEVFPGPTATTLPAAGSLTRPVPPGTSYAIGGLEYFLSPSVLAAFNVDTLGGTGVFLVTRFPF